MFTAHIDANGRRLGYIVGTDRASVELELSSVSRIVGVRVDADGRTGYYNVTPKR